MAYIRITLSAVLLFTSSIVFAKQSIECHLKVNVVASQKYSSPQTAYTTIKNDGYPMLLIGIVIIEAQTIASSKKVNAQNSY